MDNCFVRAIRYLHSTSAESQNNLRILLEEAIKTKYGPGKEIGPFINFSVFQEYPVICTSNTVSSVDNLIAKDECKAGSSSDNELELDLLKEDLMCVVCKGMGVGARNRLVECSDCHNLYHQECHDPSISEEEIEASASWICASCKDAQANKAVKKTVVTQISNISLSPKNTQLSNVMAVPPKPFEEKAEFSEIPPVKPPSSSKSSGKSSSLMSNRVLTPNINIISADKRLQIMKKKAAKLQEKRKLSR